METRERILATARQLAADLPLAKITLAEVARVSGLSWPTVRRHMASKEELQALLAAEQPDLVEASPDTRSRILTAASRVFAGHGYAHSTTDMVAADAGLSKGALYWHFQSKGDLLVALLDQMLDEQMAEAVEAVAAITGAADPSTGLELMFTRLFDKCITGHTWPRLYVEFVHQSRDPELQGRLVSFITQRRERNAMFIHQLREAGILSADLEPEATATLLDAIFDGMILFWVIDPEKFDPRPYARAFASALWRGARPSSSLTVKETANDRS